MSVDAIAESTVRRMQRKSSGNSTLPARDLVTGRPLGVETYSKCSEKDTNFIMVNRYDLVDTAFPEIDCFLDLQKTLKV